MIDAALRQRVARYFDSTSHPTLLGVLDHLQMVNSELQEGEVWEPTDPRMQAIESCVDAAGVGNAIPQLERDIETVEVLIAAWGNKPLSW